MVALTTAYSATAYTNSTAAAAASKTASTTTAVTPAAATATDDTPAATVEFSAAAKAALEAKNLATVLTEVRQKMTALLTDAKRTTPLQGGKLALDMSSLDARELYAMANSTDKTAFTDDEKKAAGLEMQRRFDAALAGPAAITKVTGNYTGLYQAAAAYLDSLGPEERADPKTVAARAALTDGLKQLATDPKTLPDAGDDDPVALYLALQEAGEASGPRDIKDVASDVRIAIDKKYDAALANGKVPTFNKNTKVGTFIDLSSFDSRSLSAIVLNQDDEFSDEEVTAANAILRSKGGAALIAGYQNAAKSSDPTAFSQNVIGIYSSMSAEERQALGWSDQFYQAAVNSFATTSKLTEMFGDASSGNATNFTSWFSK
ncbi:MAG: hypothetical protein JWR51_2140 [Devosia sp.]|uniref:hypothetical protein n=1 Tax=Devosia sp. TaxID=1871048 RepID=UPI00261196E9|nr:hypothetical protein [Devosia sp.]MDB5529037.1 hypothetical protein [Devosia sp.]